MEFLSSAFLWGLPLVSIPVVIHMIHRRRKELIRWGAMRFLLEAAARRRRIWRVEDLLLMLLRAAAIAIIVFALARPLVHASWLGGGGGRDVILVLDTSMSTARRAAENGDTRVFEKELKAAGDVIDDLEESDTLRIMTASGAAGWLTPAAISMDPGSKAKVRATLKDLQPTQSSADVLTCLGEAVAAEPADREAKRVISVITDGHAHGWRTESMEAWGDLLPEEAGETVPTAMNVVTAGAPGGSADDLSVRSVSASRALAGPEETVVFTAVVENTGNEPTDGTLLSWRVEEEETGVVTVPALSPGGSTNVKMEHVFGRRGVYRVTCSLQRDDDLSPDNEGSSVVEVIETAPVLVVDDSVEKGSLASEAGYLSAALGTVGREASTGWRSVFQPERTTTDGLRGVDLANYRCVVLANVPALPKEQVSRLEAYVREGGGLWIVLGDKTDPVSFNAAYYGEGEGLSAVPIANPVGEEEDRETYSTVYPPSPNHPATRYLSDTERLDVDQVHVYRRHRFLMPEDPGEVGVLLKTLSDEPLAVERTVGRGRVVVQAFPLRAGWSNLPALQSFVVLVHEWLWYLVEPTAVRWNLDPGEVFEVTFPAETFEETGTVETPDGTEIAVAGRSRGEETVFTFPRTAEAGDYRITLKTASGESHSYPFTVRRDPEESSLVPLGEPEMAALSSASGLNFTRDPLAMEKIEAEAPPTEPFWPWLLLLILIVMAAEVFLAGRITRKRNPGRRTVPA